jgi:DNA-binding GntR family transcriptional regulator
MENTRDLNSEGLRKQHLHILALLEKERNEGASEVLRQHPQHTLAHRQRS